MSIWHPAPGLLTVGHTCATNSPPNAVTTTVLGIYLLVCSSTVLCCVRRWRRHGDDGAHSDWGCLLRMQSMEQITLNTSVRFVICTKPLLQLTWKLNALLFSYIYPFAFSLSCAVCGTDVHYETQAIIYALWPNVRILAPRRCSLASTYYSAIYRCIHHIW